MGDAQELPSPQVANPLCGWRSLRQSSKCIAEEEAAMSMRLLCRIGRHRFLTHHNTEDGKPTHQQCARCGKRRYYGFDEGNRDLIAFGTSFL